MDIHKPKAIHNWREFLKEIGTIVIGVSIALAGEQTVEYFHWRAQVAEARTSIASEMSSNITSAVRRMRAQNCIDHRLDTLAKILDEASLAGRLPPVGIIGAPPIRSYTRGAWDSIVASQTASHFPREEMIVLGRFYGLFQIIAETAKAETEVWSSLSTMTGPGRRLYTAAEAALRKTIAISRQYNLTL